jgi:hypothetical protein
MKIRFRKCSNKELYEYHSRKSIEYRKLWNQFKHLYRRTKDGELKDVYLEQANKYEEWMHGQENEARLCYRRLIDESNFANNTAEFQKMRIRILRAYNIPEKDWPLYSIHHFPSYGSIDSMNQYDYVLIPMLQSVHSQLHGILNSVDWRKRQYDLINGEHP